MGEAPLPRRVVAERGEAGGEQAACVVQGRRGVEVRAEEALGVRRACVWVEAVWLGC